MLRRPRPTLRQGRPPLSEAPAPNLAALPAPWSHSPYLNGEFAGAPVRWVHADADACVLVIGPAARPSDPPEDPARIDYLLGLGEPERVAALLDDVVRGAASASGLPDDPFASVRRVFVQAGAFDGELGSRVHGALALPEVDSRWKWMWADRPLTVGALGGRDRAGESALTLGRLTQGPATGEVADEIGECLERAFPDASAGPRTTQALGWWGVRESGRLLGVISALHVADGGAPHLSSLGVDPVARGRGLGQQLLAVAVRDLLDEGCAFASLGVYTSNESAWRLYERIGLQHGPSFVTYRLS